MVALRMTTPWLLAREYCMVMTVLRVIGCVFVMGGSGTYGRLLRQSGRAQGVYIYVNLLASIESKPVAGNEVIRSVTNGAYLSDIVPVLKNQWPRKHTENTGYSQIISVSSGDFVAIYNDFDSSKCHCAQ